MNLSLLLAALAVGSNPPIESLTLEAAVAEALKKTTNVIQARADLLLADVEAARALSAILPRFDLGLRAEELFEGKPIIEQRGSSDIEGRAPIRGPYQDFELASQSAPSFSLALTGRQLIFDGGRWWVVLARAGDLERARKAALAAVENDARFAVAERFWELERALRSRETFQQQIEADQAALTRAEGMVATGLGRSNDVAQARRNLAEDRIALRRRDYAVLAAKRSLNLAMARAPDTSLEIVVPDQAMKPLALPPREELISQALAARPELERTKSELEILRKNVNVAAADYYPSVSLFADYSRVSRKPGRVFNLPHENYYATLGLSLEWNIFSGLETNAAVQGAEVDVARLQAAFDEEQRLVHADVDEAIDVASLALDAHALSLEAISAAEEAVRLARGLYAEGRVTQLELRDAELRLTLTKLSAIEARIDLAIAEERLRRAVGGSTPWQRGA